MAFEKAGHPVQRDEVGQRLEQRVGVPVRCINDGAAATLAEWRFGAARGYDDVVGMTIGTGIGVGAIIGEDTDADACRGVDPRATELERLAGSGGRQ